MAAIPEEFIERLKNCTTFPSPPQVALKVIELAQDPDSDLRAIADTCSGDPAIAAKIMKIANSALYASRRESTHLRQALIVLGLNATLALALSFTLVSGLRKDSPKGFDFPQFWRRAILAGAWGRLLATELNLPFAEEAFISSLLQDIGMLAIDRVSPSTYEKISPMELDHDKLAQHEINDIGADHAAIGGWLLESWNMPEQLVRAVRHSHDLDAADVEPEVRVHTRVIAISGLLADTWLSEGNEVAVKRMGVAAEKYLGISTMRLAEMFELIKEQLPITEELFEMDLFEHEQIVDITEAAREVLMIRNLHALSDAVDLQKRASQLQNENVALREETNLDKLTEVGNRKYFEESLDKEFKSAADHKWPLSLLFIDIDYFKDINDIHGHQAGDTILVEVAKLIHGTLRSEDIVARYGGDEFVVLLPGSGADAADKIGSRLVAEAVGCGTTVEGAEIKPTLSLGIVTMDGQNQFEIAEDLVAAADQALYHSKRAGRNCHTSYDDIKAA